MVTVELRVENQTQAKRMQQNMYGYLAGNVPWFHHFDFKMARASLPSNLSFVGSLLFLYKEEKEVL